MSAKTTIEWTQTTWNPVTGCTKISPGCKHCYAESFSKRLVAMRQHRYRNGFKLTLQPDIVTRPLSWKKPQLIFVNSMSDLFHKDIPEDYILEIFKVMKQAHWHTFQVLTKRSERLRELAPRLPWPKNVWMGVSVEDQKRTSRIHDLVNTPAQTKFLSIEPMLEALPHLPLTGIHWVIVGGESGLRPRPMDPSWVIDVQQQCFTQDVPFFFKQWGGRNKKKNGRLLLGKTWDEMPKEDRFQADINFSNEKIQNIQI